MAQEDFDLVRLNAVFLEDVQIVLESDAFRGQMLEGSVGEFDPHFAFGIREAPQIASRNEVIAPSKVRRLCHLSHGLLCSLTGVANDCLLSPRPRTCVSYDFATD